MLCDKCGGSGHSSHDRYMKRYIRCKQCDGSGRVHAVVTSIVTAAPVIAVANGLRVIPSSRDDTGYFSPTLELDDPEELDDAEWLEGDDDA